MEPSKILMVADPAYLLTTTLRGIIESASGSPQHELQLVELGPLDTAFRDQRISDVISHSNPRLIMLVAPLFPGVAAETILHTMRSVAPDTPLILATEHSKPDEMFKLLEEGVTDFITPPFKNVDVLPRIWRILEQTQRAHSLTETLKEKLGLKQLVGASQSFLAEIKKIPLIAKCDANILISGETGTGKELCARAIHYLSPRASKPLIPINCGATPVDLLENELFGHERGAFTGANRSQSGLIQEADGGTLFLDEIDCLSTQAQVKLLRFIQEKEYRPLGSTKIRRADVRVISATNSIVKDALREGRFRQDLFFRLNIIPLKLPPLRDRREDIPLLAEHFLTRYSAEFKKQIQGFSPKAMHDLVLYDWPGNVRELEYVVERAIALAEQLIIDEVDVGVAGIAVDSVQDSFQEAKARVIRDFERTYINSLLVAHHGNITKAAQVARKNRRAFWQLIRKHGIDARQFKLDTLSL